MLQYVFFLHYLEQKDSSEQSGIESAINEQLVTGPSLEERARWIPVNMALSLMTDDPAAHESKSRTESKGLD